MNQFSNQMSELEILILQTIKVTNLINLSVSQINVSKISLVS